MSQPEDQNRPAAARRLKTLAPLLFVAAGLAAYANVVDTYFLSDDFAQVGRVLAGDLSVVWGREHGGFFRPVFILSYALDAALWGRRPSGFHLTNVALHSLNSFLVLLLARRLFADADAAAERRRDTAALVAGLLFLLHPSHTEAVSWISGRADVWRHFRSVVAPLLPLPRPHASRARARAATPSPALRSSSRLLCFALALLSKEPRTSPARRCSCSARAATLDEGREARSSPGAKHAAPFALVLAAYVLARAAALGRSSAATARSTTQLYALDDRQPATPPPLARLFPALALRNAAFLESRLALAFLIVVGILCVVLAALVLARTSARKS